MESNKKQYNKCQKARPSNRDRRRAGGGESEVGVTRPTPAVSLPHGRANYRTSRRPATDNDDPTKPRKRPSRTTRCSAPSESGTRRVFKASYRFWRRRMEFRGMSPGRMSSGTSICASSRMEWRSHPDGGCPIHRMITTKTFQCVPFRSTIARRDHSGLGKDLTFPAYNGLAQSDVVESRN
jgi:hypothetical protein